MNKINLFLALLFCTILYSCDDSTDTMSVEFSQIEMLKNYSDNLIVPAFKAYSESAIELETATESFLADANDETLSNVRGKLNDTYQKWSKVNAFQYGDALSMNLLVNTNSFPTKFSEIESKIAAGDFNLGSISSFNVKGLPALDYLLNSGSTLDLFTTDANQANRRQYLKTVVEAVKNDADAIYNSWTSGYATEFAANEGIDPSSSISYIVNEYNKAYERCKNQRVGYALGKNSISGNSSPMSVESYYSQETLSLLKSNVESLRSIFNGGDGIGLADYLKAYYTAGAVEEDLSEKINNQFDVILAQLDKCSDSFSDHIEAKDETVETLYTEMSKLVVMIKSEMPSVLSVKITYQDSDGD
ncbi:imelysin family protein [Flammeovirga sp. MY04]|uniref:imelysin family protein n=1 Tax=Flammeovirga sp. MY04 TaxID=1191459 RepID=UPI0009FE01C0|nr:imelysin family protein [Flammeovirga sp. MY04]ANQ48700.2 imelysin family protein [Flammeovirga sp. MY04]